MNFGTKNPSPAELPASDEPFSGVGNVAARLDLAAQPRGLINLVDLQCDLWVSPKLKLPDGHVRVPPVALASD